MAKKEILEEITSVKVRGLFRKKVIVYGKNTDYNSIKIVHDYKTGEILKENYSNLPVAFFLV